MSHLIKIYAVLQIQLFSSLVVKELKSYRVSGMSYSVKLHLSTGTVVIFAPAANNSECNRLYIYIFYCLLQHTWQCTFSSYYSHGDCSAFENVL